MEPNPYIKHLAQRATGYGYIVEKSSYLLQYVNPPLVVKLGKTEEELTGTPCYSAIFSSESPCSFCKMNQTPLEESTSWYLHHEETDAHYMMCGYLTAREEGEYFVQMATGITGEIEEIKVLKESIQAEQMVTACAETLHKKGGSMGKLLQIICDFYQGSHGCFWECPSQEEALLVSNLYDKNGTFPYQEGQILRYSTNEDWISQLDGKGYVFFQEEYEKEQKALGQRKENGNLYLTFLEIEGKVVGFLALYNISANQEYFHHITTIKTFLANSFAKEQRINTLKNQNEMAQIVLEAVETLENENNYDHAIQGLLSLIDRYFSGDRAYILRQEVQGMTLEFENVHGKVMPTNQEVSQARFEVVNQWFDDFGQEDTLIISSVETQIASNPANSFEYQVLKKDKVTSMLGVRLYEKGKVKRFLIVDNPKTHKDGVSLLKSISNFVESHLDRGKILKKLEKLSYTDSLTGLYNRNFYNHYLEHLAETSPKDVAVLFADVNSLKKANDNFGHEFGDILIKWSGNYLKKQLGGMIFRIGGDEFVCFVEGISKNNFDKKILALQEGLKQESNLHMSIGFTWCAQLENVKEVMKEVDLEMYRDKKHYYQEKSQDHRSVQQELLDFKESILNLSS